MKQLLAMQNSLFVSLFFGATCLTLSYSTCSQAAEPLTIGQVIWVKGGTIKASLPAQTPRVPHAHHSSHGHQI